MTGAAVSLVGGRRPSIALLVRTAGFVALVAAVVTGGLIALDAAASDHGYLVPALRRASAAYVSGPLAGVAEPQPASE